MSSFGLIISTVHSSFLSSCKTHPSFLPPRRPLCKSTPIMPNKYEEDLESERRLFEWRKSELAKIDAAAKKFGERTIFLGPQFRPAWGVPTLKVAGRKPKLIELGYAVQADIDELQRRFVRFMKDPKVSTRKVNGHMIPPLDYLHTQAEPARTLRRNVMEHLKKMQAGSVARYCTFVDQLDGDCFSGLPGRLFNPGPDSGDLEAGWAVPACFAGVSDNDWVPASKWPAQVKAVLKQSAALLKEANSKKPGGRRVPGVVDLRNISMQNAGQVEALGKTTYEFYQYAAAVCQAAAFEATLTSIYADAPATVKLALLKSGDRYDAKVNQYIAEGKTARDYPIGKYVKDILRCLIEVVGHAEMKAAYAILTANCKVRSTKNRVTKKTHDILCIIELENGVIAEVQIGFKAVVAMKVLAHVGYQYLRVDTSNLNKGNGLQALMVQDWKVHPAIWGNGCIGDLSAIPDEGLALVSMV